jgi:uncharacterized delta-60 repeat protein
LALHALGRFNDAVSSFRRALEICPRYPQALANLGMTQQSLGEPDAALASYREALRLEPHHPDALIKLASLLEQLGRAGEAIHLYEDGIRHSPCLQFYVNLGATYISMGRADMAIGPLQSAVKFAPDCATAHVNLAVAFCKLGDNVRGLASFRRSFELQPFFPQAANIFGAFLESIGTGIYARSRSRTKAGELPTGADCKVSLSYDGLFPTPADADLRKTSQENREAFAVSDPDAPADRPHALFACGDRSQGIQPLGSGSEKVVLFGISRPSKIAFISPCCLLGNTNGAATATLDGLKLLARMGYDCQAFCGSLVDASDAVCIDQLLGEVNVLPVSQSIRIGPFQGKMIFAVNGDVRVSIVDTTPTDDGWLKREEIAAFLTGCELFLDRFQPDVVWTYGGDPVALMVHQMARHRRIPILFAIHNFSYPDKAVFANVNHVVVPGEFSKKYYRQSLGLDCKILPNIVNWEAADVSDTIRMPRDEVGSRSEPDTLPRRFVTFINPQPDKGVYVFARISRELARRQPDIPLLVTQGRSKADGLLNPGLGLAQHIAGQFPNAKTGDGRNIVTMPFTPDARKFYPAVYSVTKLLLMPSLWNESFGLVAAEAMLNGIPVLASNRGALPDTIVGGDNVIGTLSVPDTISGRGGFLFDIPAKYTPKTREVPSAEEVEPWVETIIRLWDDTAEYEQCSRAAREHAQQWHPDRLGPIYHEFFGKLTNQPEAATTTQSRQSPRHSSSMIQWIPDSSSDTITQWVVNWGDGSSDTLTSPDSMSSDTHVYQSPGDYLIQAVATAADGNSPAMLSNDVAPASEWSILSPLPPGEGHGEGGAVTSVALQPDGSIVTVNSGDSSGPLVRFTSSGQPDGTTFDDVSASIATLTSVAVQSIPGGFDVLAAGSGYSVARFNSDGSLDTTFGNAGVATPASALATGTAGVGGVSENPQMFIEPDGEIVLAGLEPDTGGGGADDLILAEFTPDGQPDGTFGTSGIETYNPTRAMEAGQ